MPSFLAVAFMLTSALHADVPSLALVGEVQQEEVASVQHSTSPVRAVPFYSQFDDITSPTWQRRGCGIASVAMIVDFYRSEEVSVDQLLYRGLAVDGYIDNIGWKYVSLVQIAEEHGITGAGRDLAHLSIDRAFTKFKKVVEDGPAIASVHYTFDPANIIPHLVVITDIKDGMVYYNDPAEATGAGSISKKKFIDSWKKRYIELQPV